MRKRLILFFFIVLLFIPSLAYAQQTYDENSPEYKEIASMFVCPECNTAGAELNDRFKGEILELMNEGYTKEEIKDYFVGVYGESILAAPETSGFSLLAWVTPIVALVVATIGVLLYIRKSVQRAKVAPPEDVE